MLQHYFILAVPSRASGGFLGKERIDYGKKYAMGSILYFALRQEGFELTDKDVSLSVCVELGDLPLGLKKSINSMTQHAASSIVPSEIGDHDKKKAIVLSCVEFANSKSVTDTVKHYLKMKR